MTFKELRKKYPVFVYERFFYALRAGNLEMAFVFKAAPGLEFRPLVTVEGIDPERFHKILPALLEQFVFHIGLAEMPSYWKAVCSPKIIVEAGYLNKAQIAFWEHLFWEGLSEFAYVNKINGPRKTFVSIESRAPAAKQKARAAPVEKNNVLVPIGGGKDSIVTLELLKKARKNLGLFVLNAKHPHREVIRVSGVKRRVFAFRAIDSLLLELNKKGFLNGHTPFSSYLAFLSVFVAALFGYGRVYVSNEKSADEENIRWKGRKINHQYSKSSDFEKRFQKYAKEYLVTNVRYESYLRKFLEIDIAKMFSAMPQYFSVFRSCNAGFVIGAAGKGWCGRCAKCFFAYLMLYPYIKEGALEKIFGKDMFADRALIPLGKRFLGRGGPKPFECVGTKKEVKTAFRLAVTKMRKEQKKVLPVLRAVQKYIV